VVWLKILILLAVLAGRVAFKTKHFPVLPETAKSGYLVVFQIGTIACSQNRTDWGNRYHRRVRAKAAVARARSVGLGDCMARL